MSAYIVSDAHINYLLTFMSANDSRYSGVYLDSIANKLRAANYASVNCRYNEEDAAPETGFSFYPGAREADPLVVLKACACFDYQACEVPEVRSGRDYPTHSHGGDSPTARLRRCERLVYRGMRQRIGRSVPRLMRCSIRTSNLGSDKCHLRMENCNAIWLMVASRQ
ncbi:MAG: hypothetical protein DMF62_11730 [Acidobacteria bacterium]|nr:MAG: hypothetical protein DMF62_11730 [Acidobacteriota bacterium]